MVCTSETPLFDGARSLLKAGRASPGDVLVMRHAGADHDALTAKVGVAAKLSIEDRPSGQRIRLAKYRQRSNGEPSRIDETPSPLPRVPPDA